MQTTVSNLVGGRIPRNLLGMSCLCLWFRGLDGRRWLRCLRDWPDWACSGLVTTVSQRSQRSKLLRTTYMQVVLYSHHCCSPTTAVVTWVDDIVKRVASAKRSPCRGDRDDRSSNGPPHASLSLLNDWLLLGRESMSSCVWVHGFGISRISSSW